MYMHAPAEQAEKQSGYSNQLNQCGPGLIPILWVEFVASLLCSERFLPRVVRIFPFLKNQHVGNLSWIELISMYVSVPIFSAHC